MMGYSHKRYDAQLKSAGFDVAKNFFAFRFLSKDGAGSHSRWERIAKAQKRIMKRYPQLSFTSINENNYEYVRKVGGSSR
jgi:hypothetical protein